MIHYRGLSLEQCCHRCQRLCGIRFPAGQGTLTFLGDLLRGHLKKIRSQ